MLAPSWVLLAWSGFAATVAAAVYGAVAGGDMPRAWSLAPRPDSYASALRWSVGAGLFIYPILYALLFEAIGRADVLAGLAAGVLHAFTAFAFVRLRHDGATALRAAGLHLVYVVVFAVLYITA